MKPLALALGLAIATHASLGRAAGSCGNGGVLGEQELVDHEGSLYYVTTPQGYSEAQPWPLIVGLHGDEGDPDSSVNYFWGDVPDGTFIFVAPKAPNASGSWYEEQETNETWMDGLFDTLRARYNVDLDRTYIWGLSGGAVFSSRYVMTRMGELAAAEFNMGGSGRNYTEPADPSCKIPARFVVSPTDNLRVNALSFFDLLTENAHETEWVDANCDGHCWDDVEMGVEARDWLLAHTLCGRTPSAGCSGDPPSGGTAGTGGTGGGDAGSPSSGGSPASGGTPDSGGSPPNGGTPGSGGTTATAGSAGSPAGGGSPPAMGSGSGGYRSTDANGPSEVGGACACALPAAAQARPTDLVTLLVLLGVGLARRRRDR